MKEVSKSGTEYGGHCTQRAGKIRKLIPTLPVPPTQLTRFPHAQEPVIITAENRGARKRGENARDSLDYRFDSCPFRGVSPVGVQPGLGLLAVGRRGLGSIGCNHSVPHGTYLNSTVEICLLPATLSAIFDSGRLSCCRLLWLWPGRF